MADAMSLEQQVTKEQALDGIMEVLTRFNNLLLNIKDKPKLIAGSELYKVADTLINKDFCSSLRKINWTLFENLSSVGYEKFLLKCKILSDKYELKVTIPQNIKVLGEDSEPELNVTDNNVDENSFKGWIVRLTSTNKIESIEFKDGNDVLIINGKGEKILEQYPGKGSRAGFLAKYLELPINSDGTSPETEKVLGIAGYKYSTKTKKWEKQKGALSIFSIYGTKLPKNNIVMQYYRDPKSYKPSFDRNNPVNEYLDNLVMSNLSTGEKIEISDIQTVANYPNTTNEGKAHKNTFNDTIAPGSVQFKFKTESSVAPGDCLVIINAKTLDGRKVNHSGYTEKALSKGRGLVHSAENPSTGIAYEHAYSEQCFICKRIADHKLIVNTLVRWGCKDGDIIQGEVINKPNSQGNEQKAQQSKQPFKISNSFSFSKWAYVPIEGIGVLGGSTFTGAITINDSKMSIFASGFFVSQNLVDSAIFFGDATLFIDGKELYNQYFKYPDYPFISEGGPFKAIGDVIFEENFSDAKSVEVDLHFHVQITVDNGINRYFANYSKERIKLK